MNPIIKILTTLYENIVAYLPGFLYGLLILFLGILLANIAKQLFISFAKLLRSRKTLLPAKLIDKKSVEVWINIVAELIKWIIIILFLIPAAEVWGFAQFTTVLNSLLLYLPNVIIAVIIGLVGFVIANLVYDIVLQGVKPLQGKLSKALANFARYTIMVFTGLIVLNQLGVAQDLIKILFTGIIAMCALAGGLAFGLGGKDTAKELLDELKKSFN